MTLSMTLFQPITSSSVHQSENIPAPIINRTYAGIELENEKFGTLKPDLHLLLDNATRWNSAFTTIQRGLRLREAINLLFAEENGLSQEDRLDNEDWKELRQLYDGLKPYNAITLRLEGYGRIGSHGVI